MARVILFGGGDGGGIIGPDGIKPIPPFDPGLLRQLRVISGLAAVSSSPKNRIGRELTPLVTKLTDLAIRHVEAKAAKLDAEHGLIFQDDDGGFTCGSTGRPPIPFSPKGPGGLR